jgi:hypothetical protein
MFGHNHGRYLMIPSPDVEDSANQELQNQQLNVGRRKRTPARRMDESSQKPKRAIAKTVACLLKIQLSIHSTEDSSSKGQLLG